MPASAMVVPGTARAPAAWRRSRNRWSRAAMPPKAARQLVTGADPRSRGHRGRRKSPPPGRACSHAQPARIARAGEIQPGVDIDRDVVPVQQAAAIERSDLPCIFGDFSERHSTPSPAGLQRASPNHGSRQVPTTPASPMPAPACARRRRRQLRLGRRCSAGRGLRQVRRRSRHASDFPGGEQLQQDFAEHAARAVAIAVDHQHEAGPAVRQHHHRIHAAQGAGVRDRPRAVGIGQAEAVKHRRNNGCRPSVCVARVGIGVRAFRSSARCASPSQTFCASFGASQLPAQASMSSGCGCRPPGRRRSPARSRHRDTIAMLRARLRATMRLGHAAGLSQPELADRQPSSRAVGTIRGTPAPRHGRAAGFAAATCHHHVQPGCRRR